MAEIHIPDDLARIYQEIARRKNQSLEEVIISTILEYIERDKPERQRAMTSLQEQVAQEFEKHFGQAPAHVVRAPGRVNLIGEHTDYNDGFVFPMAINRATWIALRPRQDQQVTVHSVDFDQTGSFSLDQLSKGEGWIEYLKGVAWALIESGYSLGGWEGVVAGDVPIGAGLSSSAALEMATARAFSLTSGFTWDASTMAKLGQKAENQWVGANTGIMDQMISASGQADHALLIDCRSLETQLVPLPPRTVIVVLDTATRHQHTESGYNERRTQCEAAARFFGVPALRDVTSEQFEARGGELEDVVRRRARHVITENARTLEAADAMRAGDAAHMGKLMDASHVSMRDDFEISRAEMDTMVEIAQSHAACYGARMTGGGFGGCAVALVRSESADDFAEVVAARYAQATGLTPSVYVCQATDGAKVIA
jgi:galactokinase